MYQLMVTQNSVRNLGGPFPARNLATPKHQNFRAISHNFISGTQQDIVNQKTALQTTDTPAQANLIWFTLVHKRRKIGLEF